MRKRVLFHIGFWFLYTLFMGYTVGRYDMHFGRAYIQELFLLPVRMIAVYSSFYFIDRFRTKQNGILLTVYITLIIIGATLINRLVFGYIVTPRWFAGFYTFHFWDFYRLPINMADMLTVVGIAGLIKLVNEKLESEQREKELLKEKLQAELLFLRSQTNPHFLFNTINTIYALARKKSDKTSEVIMRLSKLLRFMLYESSAQTISIHEEAAVIKDYIELEKLRFDDRLLVRYSESIDLGSQPVTPLLLLPLVENAFKHGASESRFSIKIDIHLQLTKGELEFTVTNSKEGESSQNEKGIGLKNIRRQLELMYPHAHQLLLKDGEAEFSAFLKVNLDRYAEI